MLTTPSRVFLIIAVVSGLLFLTSTPPFRFPDEPGHYLRAASVAQHLFDDDSESRDIARLPPYIAESADYFSSRALEAAHGRPFGFSEITSSLGFFDTEAHDVTRQVPAAQMVPHSLGYLPQALGFTIASRAGASFLLSLWSVRLAVLLASTLITVLALELMPPWAQWTSVTASLVPMAAYLRASASPDALVTAMALLGIAAFLRGTERTGNVWYQVLAALVACMFVAVVKAPYACILLLSVCWMPAESTSIQSSLGRVIKIGSLWTATCAAAVWHAVDVAPYVAKIRADVAPAAIATADKVNMLFWHPLAASAVFVRTLSAAPGWLYSAIARFGWMDINPSPTLHILVVLWCGAILYLDRQPIAANVSVGRATILLATFAAQCVLVVLTTWLAWTETASRIVTGVQGRYFLPVLTCGLLGTSALLFRFRTTGHSKSEARMLLRVVGIGASLLLLMAFGSAMLGEFFGVQGFRVICLHDLCKPG
jgi:uncharacterized membrane protein